MFVFDISKTCKAADFFISSYFLRIYRARLHLIHPFLIRRYLAVFIRQDLKICVKFLKTAIEKCRMFTLIDKFLSNRVRIEKCKIKWKRLPYRTRKGK